MNIEQLEKSKALKEKMDALETSKLAVIFKFRDAEYMNNREYKNNLVVTDYNTGSVIIPKVLQNIILTMLEDFYKAEYDELKDEFGKI